MNELLEKIKNILMNKSKKHVLLLVSNDILGYEEVIKLITDENFIIINDLTPLEFRLFLETDIHESDGRYFVIGNNFYAVLPDIEEIFHVTHINISDLINYMPKMLLNGLSFKTLSMLYKKRQIKKLEEEQGYKFILENIYNIDFETLRNSKENILNAIIIITISRDNQNLILKRYLKKILAIDYPSIEVDFTTETNMLQYFEEQWRNFVLNDNKEIDFLSIGLLNSFRSLFYDCKLKPIKVDENIFNKIPQELRCGVYIDEEEKNENIFKQTLEQLNKKSYFIENNSQGWGSYITLFAKAKLMELETKNELLKKELLDLEKEVNEDFQKFLENGYDSLFTLIGKDNPALITRVLDYICFLGSKKPKCLIVIDGMNYWQSLLLVDKLKEHNIQCTQKFTMAYIPTITAYSRQALLKGDRPNLNEDNSKEENLFKEYWKNKKTSNAAIGYIKSDINKESQIDDLSDIIRFLAIVNNDLDTVMHSVTLGNKELFSSTNEWLAQTTLLNDIELLQKKDYKIFITTDHGNIEAKGIKRLKSDDKVGTPSKGKRHLVFYDEELKDIFIKTNKEFNLGEKNNSVYIKDYGAFETKDEKIITHGGSHFWEVVIPFIEIN